MPCVGLVTCSVPNPNTVYSLQVDSVEPILFRDTQITHISVSHYTGPTVFPASLKQYVTESALQKAFLQCLSGDSDLVVSVEVTVHSSYCSILT